MSFEIAVHSGAWSFRLAATEGVVITGLICMNFVAAWACLLARALMRKCSMGG